MPAATIQSTGRLSLPQLVARLRVVRDELQGIARHIETCAPCANEPHVQDRVRRYKQERELLDARLVEIGYYDE